ncbi:Protein CURVATURE THYLAKOID 1C, chloroplastic, partial [Linum grandiflorum]
TNQRPTIFSIFISIALGYYLWCAELTRANTASISIIITHQSLLPFAVCCFHFLFQRDMASILASLPPPPPLMVRRRKTLFVTLQPLPLSPLTGGKDNRAGIISKATGESSDSSSSISVVKSVQTAWDKSEDRVGIIGLGFAAVVALWASTSLVAAIDKLPVAPSVLELVGILYSTWFVYRYLLFKPNREELVQIINKSVSEILGQ